MSKIRSRIILDMIYPVGSIYLSTNNINPSDFVGGTWESWGAGKVPVGVDTNQSEFNAVEKTGGEKSHTLTTNEMPSHSHTVTHRGYYNTSAEAGVDDRQCASALPITSDPENGGYNCSSVGGGQSHNNLQPYITCYMWKRTA